jgi:hypothetical protein
VFDPRQLDYFCLKDQFLFLKFCETFNFDYFSKYKTTAMCIIKIMLKYINIQPIKQNLQFDIQEVTVESVFRGVAKGRMGEETVMLYKRKGLLYLL